MKLRVVGWVFPYYNFEQGEVTWSVRNAIIDEIRKRGYKFSGNTHQDSSCTPVLNNGKKYLFSSRGWGDLMAEAHGYTGMMDYLQFSSPVYRSDEVVPDWDDNEFDTYIYSDEYDFEEEFESLYGKETDEEYKKAMREEMLESQQYLKVETDLNERFEVEVKKEDLNAAKTQRQIILPVLPELRYLDRGDTLALTCEGQTAEFIVENVERKRDLSEERLQQLIHETYDYRDHERAARAQDEIDRATMILAVTLKKDD